MLAERSITGYRHRLFVPYEGNYRHIARKSCAFIWDKGVKMPGGCWVCNPFCGKCQPAPKKSYTCPTCGICTIFDRRDIIAGKDLLCKKCGRDLSTEVRPQPIKCHYSGLWCAYPCGKSKGEISHLGYQVCKRNTPPSDGAIKTLEEQPPTP